MATELVLPRFIRQNENRNVTICSSKFDVERYNLLAQVPTCSTQTVNLTFLYHYYGGGLQCCHQKNIQFDCNHDLCH